jgi:hypothetical protein
MQKRSKLVTDLLKYTCDVPTKHLPLGASLIAYNLLLNLRLSQQNGDTPTVKSLFASIPYSDMGIRYHMRQLLDDGWMELKPSDKDKRTRICMPTDKFDVAWALVIEQISHQLDGELVCHKCGGGV